MSAFAWATALFLVFHLLTTYWHLDVQDWNYYLEQTALPSPPPPPLHLSVRKSGTFAHVGYDGTTVKMQMRLGFPKHPSPLDFAFVSPAKVSLAGLTGTNFVLRANAKDRTRMRTSLLRRIHTAVGGVHSLDCVVVWHTDHDRNDGLADWCTVKPDEHLFLMRVDAVEQIFNTPTQHPHIYALFGNTQSLPAALPGPVDVDAYASWFITSEMARGINLLCVNELFKRQGGKTVMVPPFANGNALGTRYDRGVSMADDGYVNTLVRSDTCLPLQDVVSRPGVAAAIRAKWRSARKGPLSDSSLLTFMDTFDAEHGQLARQTFDLYTDGRGRRKYPLAYNTFLGNLFVPRNVHSYPGGRMINVPRTYDGHVADLKQYLLRRAAWLDAHIDDLTIAPSTGPVHPLFVASVAITVAYFVTAVAICGLAAYRWRKK